MVEDRKQIRSHDLLFALTGTRQRESGKIRANPGEGYSGFLQPRPAEPLEPALGLFVERLEFRVLALEFGNQSFHRGDYCHVIGRKRQLYHACDAFADFSVVIFAHLGDLDFTVECGERSFSWASRCCLCNFAS